jgi:dTDP-4-dehydrorhamnose 3,5-epimerase
VKTAVHSAEQTQPVATAPGADASSRFQSSEQPLAVRGQVQGVQVIPLVRIPDERGTIMHMLRKTDGHFIAFGEIYFSTIYPGAIKGWHKHREMTLNYAVPFGRVKLVIYDDRAESATRGMIQEVFLGPDNYSLVQIPPGLWNGFKGMSRPTALLANCCTHVHDPSLSVRISPFDSSIPYDWGIQHA